MTIIDNINDVKNNIKSACKKGYRKVDDVTLIAVSKTKPIEAIQEAIAGGMIIFGENKVQEIRDKYPVFDADVKWHMIGHLQTNKIKYIVDKVAMIHSVDSIKLAAAIDKEAKKRGVVVDILVQVMVAFEETKFGVSVEELEELLREIAVFGNIKVRGLMTVAPFVEDPEMNRPIFRKLKKILVDMNLKNIDNINMDVLSMGMTNDYEVAIEEGATMIRVGTGIFGKRNYMKG